MVQRKKKKRGRPIKGDSKRRRASFTLPPKQLKWLKNEAKDLNTTMSGLLSHIISEFQYSRSGIPSAIRSRLHISKTLLADFCHCHNIKKLSVYGSILTDRFTPESDIDILVEFDQDVTPSYFTIVRIEQELSQLLGGREVDLKTPSELSRYFKSKVFRNAEVLYAA